MGRPDALEVTLRIKPEAVDGFDTVRAELARVVRALGNNVTARTLRVDKALVSRWMSGAEAISTEKRKGIGDLDFVLKRGLAAFTPRQLGLWLSGSEPHLGGARPIDVLVTRGVGTVIDAIDAIEQGAFA
jgi:uncharacterized protein (DUF2384 family)